MTNALAAIAQRLTAALRADEGGHVLNSIHAGTCPVCRALADLHATVSAGLPIAAERDVLQAETPRPESVSPEIKAKLPWALDEIRRRAEAGDPAAECVAMLLTGTAALLADRDVLREALKEARAELEMAFHKFERAGGIWAVADRGVPLGAQSWASNVENSLNNTKAVLEAAIARAEATSHV